MDGQVPHAPQPPAPPFDGWLLAMAFLAIVPAAYVLLLAHLLKSQIPRRRLIGGVSIYMVVAVVTGLVYYAVRFGI